MRTRSALVLTAFLLAAGCATEPVYLTDPDPALLSKGGGKGGGGGGGGGTSNPNAMFTFYDVAGAGPAGIMGDGRAADGSSATDGTSTYDHDQCGVTSTLWADGSLDATMDPVGGKAGRKNCSSTTARSLTVDFGQWLGGQSLPPATGGHYTNVREVLALDIGEEWADRRFTLLLRGTHACERVRYDAQVTAFGFQGSAVRVTRTGPGEWIAESLPDGEGRHVAFCQVGGTGAYAEPYNPGTQLGAYHLPFRIMIRQK